MRSRNQGSDEAATASSRPNQATALFSSGFRRTGPPGSPPAGRSHSDAGGRRRRRPAFVAVHSEGFHRVNAGDTGRTAVSPLSSRPPWDAPASRPRPPGGRPARTRSRRGCGTPSAPVSGPGSPPRRRPSGARQRCPGCKAPRRSAAAAAVPPGPVPPGHSRGDTLLIPPAASHVSSFLLRWLHCTTAPYKGKPLLPGDSAPLRHKELGGAAQKVSNDSWKLFTVSCCKSCPFMLLYRKRDLKLHESVVNRSAHFFPAGRGGLL